MRLLLDTHTLLWWLADERSLSAGARGLIEAGGNSIFVSAATAWEIGTKVRLGKLPGAENLAVEFASHLERERFEPLSISVEHGIRAGMLPGRDRDPFDRMLAAQSQSEDLAIVSNDAVFDSYGVRRLW